MNRDSKSTFLYGFLKMVDSLRTGERLWSYDELITRYLDDMDAMDKAWAEIAAMENLIYKKNQRLLKAVRSVKGKAFHSYILDILKECEANTDVFKIVRTPRGTFQDEKWGKEIKGLWVDQWSVGTEGDSFEGYICVQLKPNRWLQFSYSM